MVNSASQWNAGDYARNAGFVPALGAAALALLAPQPNELIVDIGCGDGVLTAEIAKAGAQVIGFDASPDMVEAARGRGIDAFVADAQTLDLDAQVARFGQFDAAFSNAALHWMLDPAAVARGVFALVRSGGRFVGEMGGEGNIRLLRTAIREELTARGYPIPADDPQWYASVAEFTSIYAAAGFSNIEAQLIERPTPLSTGVTGWLGTFRAGWFDVAGVLEADRAEVAEAIEKRLEPLLKGPDGIFYADYVRLRFRMERP